mmetsp:Transcript_90102/g.110270  ORF Transcript_90102/g.110270 Transcript_90102/m.110270 type:complete len:463 (-) Transcript_90102:103-1491(-)
MSKESVFLIFLFVLIGGESIKKTLYYNSCNSFDKFYINGNPSISDNDRECPHGSSNTCIKLRGRDGTNDMVDIILENIIGFYDIVLQFDARGSGVDRFITYYKFEVNSDWIIIWDSNTQQTFNQTFFLELNADNKNNKLFIRFENTDTGNRDECYIDEVYIYGKVITPSPTNNPSASPTKSPSTLTHISTNVSSATPTVFPTVSPTTGPSLPPTKIPSLLPTTTLIEIPSQTPTLSPSIRPTISQTLPTSSVITNNGTTTSLPFNLSMETFLIIIIGTFILLMGVIILLVLILCRNKHKVKADMKGLDFVCNPEIPSYNPSNGSQNNINSDKQATGANIIILNGEFDGSSDPIDTGEINDGDIIYKTEISQEQNVQQQDTFQNRNFENHIITDIVNDANEDSGVNKNITTPIDDKTNVTTPIDDMKVTTVGNDDSVYDEVSYASEIVSCASEGRINTTNQIE